jgi:hypothetical protein
MRFIRKIRLRLARHHDDLEPHLGRTRRVLAPVILTSKWTSVTRASNSGPDELGSFGGPTLDDLQGLVLQQVGVRFACSVSFSTARVTK